jgi:hypothetical protein
MYKMREKNSSVLGTKMNRRSFLGILTGAIGVAVVGVPAIQKRLKYIFVPEFEITSNPRISLGEVRTRRFDIIVPGTREINKKYRGHIYFSNKIAEKKMFLWYGKTS